MSTSGLLIALSAGGDDLELAEVGIGLEHVEELMVRLSVRLLECGHRLAYGGTIGVQDQDLTKHLIDTAVRWSEEGDERRVKEGNKRRVDVNQPKTWPIINYSSWPYYEKIDLGYQAKLVGLCHFVNCDPRTTRARFEEAKTNKALRDRLTADALTEMRKQVSLDTQLRIVWAGKIKGSSGWMAGILEEVACSLELKRPIIILGGFGGCAKRIADFLADRRARWPQDLDLKACANPDRDANLTKDQSDSLRDRFIGVQKLLEEFRHQLHGETKVNGLSTKPLLALLTEDNPRQVLRIVAELVAEL